MADASILFAFLKIEEFFVRIIAQLEMPLRKGRRNIRIAAR